MKLKQVIITKLSKIAPNTFTIEFERNFSFKPGQIIGITNNENIAPRLYSICSAPDEKHVRILFNIKPDGELTPPLAKAKAGTPIFITPVQGKFLFYNQPAWWIATGTGIAPYYSMFKAGMKPQKLIQGGRTKSDFYFENELNKLPDYIKCCTQQSIKGYYQGRLTKYLVEYDKLPTDINYYICGSAEMVVDVRNLLINNGVPYGNILTEIYF